MTPPPVICPPLWQWFPARDGFIPPLPGDAGESVDGAGAGGEQCCWHVVGGILWRTGQSMMPSEELSRSNCQEHRRESLALSKRRALWKESPCRWPGGSWESPFCSLQDGSGEGAWTILIAIIIIIHSFLVVAQVFQACLKSKISHFPFPLPGMLFPHILPWLPSSAACCFCANVTHCLKWPHNMPVDNSVLPSLASCPPCPLPLLTFPHRTYYQPTYFVNVLFCSVEIPALGNTGPGIQLCLQLTKCRHC